MTDKQLLESSCRLALAAFLHDLGKFTERARIAEAQEKDEGGNTRRDVNVMLCCPRNKEGRNTHIHAAYTAIGLDLLEKHLPEIVGEDMNPFAPWKDKNADDSVINAAAKHHRPDTFLQWIIATADRLASGFEREEFNNYNAAADDEQKGLNHYTTRQWTLLERIRLSDRPESQDWRYPLKVFSPQSIFPVRADDQSEGETDNNTSAQKRYLDLWNHFNDSLKDIPASHRRNLPLWLDHFESLWLTCTHAIPSATAGIGGGVRPDVSLYDHSKCAAALAVALWRYHADMGHDPETVREQLRAQWDKERSTSREAFQAWDDEKFLIVQGDFFGIQNFIFSEGSQTQKRAAKLLRGRSFYVSLLTELAALKVLEALDLPATSQVVNAAGKFLIVAHNTPHTIAKLQGVQIDLDSWFLEHTYGQSGIGLAWLKAKASDFRQAAPDVSPFRDLLRKLFEQLEAAKLQRFRLCGKAPADVVFGGFSLRFEHGECRIDGRSPADRLLEKDIWVSRLAFDQVQVGKWLATEDRLLVSNDRIAPLPGGQTLNQLDLSVFGYHLLFTRDEERTGKFGDEARSGNLRRAWDFSWPDSASAPLWNGYARRHINAFVGRFTESDLAEAGLGKYDSLSEEDRDNERPNASKTLNHLAQDDRKLDENGGWIGAQALMTLKGDVDNLGLIFQTGLKNPTFAKMAALSRQMNAFFAVYLPWLCQSEATFRNTYTVFAGGDDFFIIGPWHSTIKLAQRMKDDFKRYVAENPDIHFSAGLSMTKAGLPIRQLATLADEALDKAKRYGMAGGVAAPKNAVTAFGEAVTWSDFDQLMQREASLARTADQHALSTSYLYALLRFTEMAADKHRPENALWHSQFAYRTRRLAETRYREVDERTEREDRRRRLQTELGTEIAGLGIERHGAAYKIALFTYLYQQRD